MTTIDQAIDSLTKLVEVFARDGNELDRKRAECELWGYLDVRDGRPRLEREQDLHHADFRARYRQARLDALVLVERKKL